MDARSAIMQAAPQLNEERDYPWYATGMALVCYIAAVRLVLLLLTANRYGFFGDEMYYLDCARHLDWGYVDQPPMIALVTWFVRHVFGDSLFALHLLPAISGAAKVVLTGVIARELGARRVGMALAALATTCAIIYWPLDHLFTMNTFEPLLWMGCALVIIRIIKTGNQRLWLWFGVLAGIGMETKYSTAIFGLGVVVGLLLTPERKAFASKWFWIAMAIALAIWMPNIIWNVQHHWPFLELMRDINASGRDIKLGPMAFVLQQIMVMGPATLPIWLAGALYLFFARDMKPYRILGWIFLTVFGTLLLLKGKDYYVVPVYPIVFAAGAIAFERTFSGRGVRWLTAAAAALMTVEMAVYLPYAIPVLSVENFLKYEKVVPMGAKASEKNHQVATMPHYYTWNFGWEEMVSAVAKAYYSLPPEERAKAAIYAQHFGQAGAVDLFGKKYGLPDAICGHQNYWLWGPRDYTGEIVIVIGSTPEGERNSFEQVDVGATFENPHGYPWEQRPILICRRLKPSLGGNLQQLWPKMKHWD
jgi:Dolichyl-phosphate-mannose-protein mannosyltransferase